MRFFTIGCCVLFLTIFINPEADASNNEFYRIHKIIVVGNHTTKERIIIRELPFHVGDTLEVSQLEQKLKRARFNLLNTSLFNFVTIDTLPNQPKVLDILIEVKERWYIVPAPYVTVSERNFNSWWLNPTLYRATYGVAVVDQNFRGLNEQLSLGFSVGYFQQYNLNYTLPFIDSKQRNGIGFGLSYTRSHEVYYKTNYNEIYYLRNDDQNLRDELAARITYTYRKDLYLTHTLELRYVNTGVADTLVALNQHYLGPTKNYFSAFFLRYGFKYDFRDIKSYPLKGYFLNLDLSKQGLGLLPHESIDLTVISASIRGYTPLVPRLYIGASLKLKWTPNGQPPYYLQRALGFNNDYVRGYELYVVDGQSFGLLKTNLRYQLLKPKVIKVAQIRTEKFNTLHYALYLSAFADAGYVADRYYQQTNFLNNNFLLGRGLGIDFVTYYDLVMRIEYTWNSLGHSGLFLHFAAPF